MRRSGTTVGHWFARRRLLIASGALAVLPLGALAQVAAPGGDWERIGDGQSNITYRIIRGGESFVLRRGPRPPLR